MKFFVALMIAATLGAGGHYVYENASVTKCHEDKFLGIKYGETCEKVKLFAHEG